MLQALGERIIKDLSAPYIVADVPIEIGASVGIAVSGRIAKEPDILLYHADMALYAAKRSGRGCVHFYGRRLEGEIQQKRRLAAELERALALGQMEIHYQPVMHLAEQKLHACIALLRWRHPRLGLLSPDEFMACALRSKLAVRLGTWVVRQACKDIVSLPSHVSLVLNAADLHLDIRHLASVLTHACASAEIAPHRVVLEMQSVALQGAAQQGITVAAAINNLGARIVLDDFGEESSALDSLRHFTVSGVKIGKTLTQSALIGEKCSQEIVIAIAALARNLQIPCAVPFVETAEEFVRVQSWGCSHVYGLHWGAPLLYQELQGYFSDERRTAIWNGRCRKEARSAMQQRVAFECADHIFEGCMRNLSRTGAMIETSAKLTAGARIVFQVVEGEALEARVCWAAGGCIGVVFTQPHRSKKSGDLRVAQAAMAIAQNQSTHPWGHLQRVG